MKLMITIGATVGGIVGGLLGIPFDGGFGGISILLSMVGGILGIWAGYKAAKYFGE